MAAMPLDEQHDPTCAHLEGDQASDRALVVAAGAHASSKPPGLPEGRVREIRDSSPSLILVHFERLPRSSKPAPAQSCQSCLFGGSGVYPCNETSAADPRQHTGLRHTSRCEMMSRCDRGLLVLAIHLRAYLYAFYIPSTA
jgi:hypothetical protein